MFLVLGASNYIGQAFGTELRRRGKQFIPLSRRAFDYTQFELLFEYVRKIKPRFIINAASHSAAMDGSGAELPDEQIFQINTILPQTIARVCNLTNTPWGHVSSAKIYTGAKVLENGSVRLVRNLDHPRVRRLFKTQPDKFLGFSETDEPNCTFRMPPCTFWEGTMALAEEALHGESHTYVWRAGLVFNEHAVPSNLLFKLQNRPSVEDKLTCMSQVDEFVRACLDLVQRGAAFGTYNIVNPGTVSTQQVCAMVQRVLKPRLRDGLWSPVPLSGRNGDQSEGSGCMLDTTKLLHAGAQLRPVKEALERALGKWECRVWKSSHSKTKPMGLFLGVI